MFVSYFKIHLIFIGNVCFFCCECVLFKACLAWEDNLVLQQHISQTQPLLLQLKLWVVREIYFVFFF